MHIQKVSKDGGQHNDLILLNFFPFSFFFFRFSPYSLLQPKLRPLEMSLSHPSCKERRGRKSENVEGRRGNEDNKLDETRKGGRKRILWE